MILTKARIDHEARAGIWPNRILTDYITDTISENPDAIALIANRMETGLETRLSYRELDARAGNIAGNLTGLGIGKGDVVSFQLPNWWEFVAVHLACLKIGAISNPLMPIFRARELEFMVGFAESRVFIVPRVFQNFDHEELGNQLLEQIETLEHLIVVGGEGDNAFEKVLMGKPDAAAPETSPLSPNDVVQLLYTSGTTGQPKGVMHTSNTLLTSAMQVAERLTLENSDTGFMPAPFAHQIGFCFGMMMPICLGNPVVIMDCWDPAIAIDLIERHRVSYTCASTPFMVDLANVPDVEKRDLDCFRVFMTAGAPIMEPAIKKALRKLEVHLSPGWGMSEVIQATAAIPFSALNEPLNDGVALPGCELRVIDHAGQLVRAHAVGNLQCKGPTLFVGYCKKPELYDVSEDGWFDTGDLAWMDEKENIRIAGRDKDIIIRGGENVPVLEVESLICQMPGVREVALVAMPDERLGERGCAFVTLEKGTTLSFEGMVSFLKEEGLAIQYFPEWLELVEEMPQTPSGKIQKFVLREWAEELAEKGIQKTG